MQTEKINVVITGSTGMVGRGVLLECLDHNSVARVLVVNRSPIGLTHEKMEEVLLKDFNDPSPVQDRLKDHDAVFFCLGVSAAGMKEEQYHEITYGYTVRFAEAFKKMNTEGTFIYVSGQGTDSTEKSRTMWARVKGKTENAVINLFGANAYLFRPGIIQPLRGIKSRTPLYNTAYVILRPLWPLLLALFGKNITNTTRIGKAMIQVALHGSDKRYLENKDINAVASEGPTSS